MSTNPFEPPKEVNEPQTTGKFWRMGWQEWLVIAAIIAVLAFLLLPGVQMSKSK